MRRNNKWSFDPMRIRYAPCQAMRVFGRIVLYALLLSLQIKSPASAQVKQPTTARELPSLDQQTEKLARIVTIHRDSFGVPHVFGKTDAGVVFGLMYAQC